MENEYLEEKSLLSKWLRRVKRKQLAHRLAAKRKGNYHLWLGIPAVIISATVGLFAFSTIDSNNMYFIIGGLSLLVTILTSLQTFLKFEIKAKNHQDAEIGYGQIRHDIEEILTFIGSLSKDELKSKCGRIKLKIENTSNHSPLVSESIWKLAKEKNGNSKN